MPNRSCVKSNTKGSGVKCNKQNKDQLLHRIASLRTLLIYNNIVTSPHDKGAKWLMTRMLATQQTNKNSFQCPNYYNKSGSPPAYWKILVLISNILLLVSSFLINNTLNQISWTWVNPQYPYEYATSSEILKCDVNYLTKGNGNTNHN